MRSRARFLPAILLLGIVACRGPREVALPAPETDARAMPDVSTPFDTTPACLRLTTCGQWAGCVWGKPQPLPFSVRPGESMITSGTWYRFDANGRTDQVGSRAEICIGDAGPCFTGIQHVIPCLPYFNPTAATYRCEVVAGACREVRD